MLILRFQQGTDFDGIGGYLTDKPCIGFTGMLG
jgi:hypothetical protein